MLVCCRCWKCWTSMPLLVWSSGTQRIHAVCGSEPLPSSKLSDGEVQLIFTACGQLDMEVEGRMEKDRCTTRSGWPRIVHTLFLYVLSMNATAKMYTNRILKVTENARVKYTSSRSKILFYTREIWLSFFYFVCGKIGSVGGTPHYCTVSTFYKFQYHKTNI